MAKVSSHPTCPGLYPIEREPVSFTEALTQISLIQCVKWPLHRTDFSPWGRTHWGDWLQPESCSSSVGQDQAGENQIHSDHKNREPGRGLSLKEIKMQLVKQKQIQAGQALLNPWSTTEKASTLSWSKSWQTFLQWIVNIFGSVGHKVSVTTTQLCHLSAKSARQYVNEWVWLRSNKTLFRDTEIWISYNFHVSQNITLVLRFLTIWKFKNYS